MELYNKSVRLQMVRMEMDCNLKKKMEKWLRTAYVFSLSLTSSSSSSGAFRAPEKIVTYSFDPNHKNPKIS